MRKPIALVPIVLFAAVGLFGVASHETLSSDFTEGPEAWEVRGPAAGPLWEPRVGNPPGSISAVKVGAGPEWFFHAPEKFIGVQAELYGRILRYDIRCSGGEGEPGTDVLLRGAGRTLVHVDSRPRTSGWTRRSVRLKEGESWCLKMGDLTAPATRADLRATLAELRELQISGGSWDSVGPVYLDNVMVEGPDWNPVRYLSSILYRR